MDLRGCITCLAVFVTCYDLATGSESYRINKDKHHHDYSHNCDRQWTSINPRHTLCLKDVGTAILMSENFKHVLVKLHNKIRKDVHPHASDMTKLTWDNDLALVAEKWAKQCKTYSDNPLHRQIPSMPGVGIGQNTAYYYKNFREAIAAWAEEKRHLGFEVGFYEGAAANYSQDRDYLRPYSMSYRSCSACPHKCDSTGKLCDCKGKLCLNDGKLNVETCSCICNTPFTGDTCGKPA